MSSELVIYSSIAFGAMLVALLMIKLRNAIDLSRCVGWYLLVFGVTYIVRPAASLLTGDLWMYQWLRLGSFEDHWQLMGIAVPLAILSFSAGYAASAPSRAEMRARAAPEKEPAVDPHKVRIVIFSLIALGYFAAIVCAKTNTMSGEAGDYAGAAVGVYEHNTAWFAQDDLFISTGSILYYILTGSLAMSLLLAAPWMVLRVILGWGRSHLLGHFFSLMAVYFLKARMSRGPAGKSSQKLVIGLAVLLVLVLFPLMGMLRVLKKQLGLNAASMSKDVAQLVQMGADPQDMMQSYLGTNSSVAGFEETLSRLLSATRPELGTQYLYYYLIKPIPRIIWPGKGTPFTWPERLRGIEPDTRMTIIGALSGSIGMAYQEWGWMGIPLEFLFAGWLFRRSEEAVRRRPHALHLQLGYVGLYGMLPMIGRDSLLDLIANHWLFQYGIPVFILWRIYQAAAEQVRLRKAVPSVPGAPLVAGAQTAIPG